VTGLARSAPTSNNSFCTRPSSRDMPDPSAPNVIAMPIAQFASSTSA
jgi:hypothetical protein